MKPLVLLPIVVFAVVFSGFEVDTAPQDAQGRDWNIKLISVEMPKEVQVYGPADHGTTGSGEIIEAPSTSGIVIIKAGNGEAYTFLAGKIQPTDETKVFVLATFEVTNMSDTSRSFRVGDLICNTNKKERRQFSALAKGNSMLFAKFRDVEKKAAEAVTITLGPNQRERITYLFGAEKDEIPLRCSFQNGPSIDLQK